MHRFRQSSTVRVIALMMIGLLVTTGVVYADLKAVAEVDAWDIGANPPGFVHSQVYFPADGTWMPFLHQLNFDTDEFLWDYPTDPNAFPWGDYYILGDPSGWDGSYPGGCTGTLTTRWEGVMHWGLYHEDNDSEVPAERGNGFQETRLWRLTHCDRDRDDKFDGTDKQLVPAGPWEEIANHPSAEITLLRQDFVDNTQCGGNCYSEIITTIFVSLDTDCDGNLDDHVPYSYWQPGPPAFMDVCFYGEALTPWLPDWDPIWEGTPLQARIRTVGTAGDKTVSFQVKAAATLVELTSFTARWVETVSQPLVLWATLAAAGAAVLGALLWWLRPARR